MKTEVDVLVVGAGPVGLLLAAELARGGVNALLVESRSERSFFCKALGVTPRTLELFDDLGFAQDAIDRGVWMRAITAFHDGVVASTMEVPAELPFGMLSLAQFDTERLLETCLHRHGGAVNYGWRLTGYEERADNVLAVLENDGERREVTCRWLVGCDGAHSKVRSLAGIGYDGGQYPQTFVLADLQVQWDLERGRAYRFHVGEAGQPGTRNLMAVPVHDAAGSRYRLSTVLPESAPGQPAGTGESGSPALEEIREIMLPLLPRGTVLADLHWSSIYRVSHRIASEYSRGRVFIAGDAAHIHPPVGGQGMNTGLQDAHNLAWKLQLASRGLAAPALLESYNAERRPVGLDVVENTSRALSETLAQRSPAPGMRETQLLISYPTSPIVRKESDCESLAGAGDRAPDAGLLKRAYVSEPIRLHDLLGRGRHVLLGYFPGGDIAQIGEFQKMLAFIRQAFGETGCGYTITAPESQVATPEDVPLLVDSDQRFSAAYGTQAGMVWLVRPDGHVGWCTASPSLERLRSFLATFLQLPAGEEI